MPRTSRASGTAWDIDTRGSKSTSSAALVFGDPSLQSLQLRKGRNEFESEFGSCVIKTLVVIPKLATHIRPDLHARIYTPPFRRVHVCRYVCWVSIIDFTNAVIQSCPGVHGTQMLLVLPKSCLLLLWRGDALLRRLPPPRLRGQAQALPGWCSLPFRRPAPRQGQQWRERVRFGMWNLPSEARGS